MTGDSVDKIANDIRAALATAERQGYDRGVAEGYERGVAETMQKIQSLVMGATSQPVSGHKVAVGTSEDAAPSAPDSPHKERQRAPKGLVRKVIVRELQRLPGLTPSEIEAGAEGELEEMISSSSYRSELRKGLKEGTYREEGGKWFLADQEKAEDSTQSKPSAFGF